MSFSNHSPDIFFVFVSVCCLGFGDHIDWVGLDDAYGIAKDT